MNNWSVQEVWNKELVLARERTLKPRTHMWASDLGKNYYERYLKMTAIEPDFPYNERTLRKFEAGNLFERIVGFVLMSSGLLKHDNKWYQIPEDSKTLAISVKPDFIAGGKPDWSRVKEDLKKNMLFELMPNLERIAKKLVENLSEKYPNGLNDLVYEIKSINSMVFWSKKDYLKEAYPHHRLQAFAEMRATGLPEARLLYISKDDLTVAEFSLFLNDSKLIKSFEEDTQKMTEFIRTNTEPPKPDFVVFDKHRKLRYQKDKKKKVIQGCYVPNWQVFWSNYITRMTGITGDTQKKVSERWQGSLLKEISLKNQTLKEANDAKKI